MNQNEYFAHIESIKFYSEKLGSLNKTINDQAKLILKIGREYSNLIKNKVHDADLSRIFWTNEKITDIQKDIKDFVLSFYPCLSSISHKPDKNGFIYICTQSKPDYDGGYDDACFSFPQNLMWLEEKDLKWWYKQYTNTFSEYLDPLIKKKEEKDKIKEGQNKIRYKKSLETQIANAKKKLEQLENKALSANPTNKK